MLKAVINNEIRLSTSHAALGLDTHYLKECKARLKKQLL